MARSSKTPSKNQSSAKKAKPAAQKSADKGTAAPQKRKLAATQEVAVQDRMLDDKSRRDIIGVSCVIGAVVLFIITVMPANGLVSSWLSTTLHLVLGVGSYLLPVFLLLIAGSLYMRSGEERVSTRVSLGLFLLFFAILVLSALYTPGAAAGNLDNLFLHDNLISHGGYIGAGVAWVLLLLFGRVVATILLMGFMLISLIVVGFSLSDFFDKVGTLRDRALYGDESDDMDYLPAGPINRRGQEVPDARISRGKPSSAAKTAVLASPDDAKRAYNQAVESEGKVDSVAITRKLGQPKKKASSDKQKQTKSSTSSRKQAPSGAPTPSEGFVLPSMQLLSTSAGSKQQGGESESSLQMKAQLLEDTLDDFGIAARVVDWVAGPTVTLFKVDLPAGVRVSKIVNLQDDIALALAAIGVRIFAPIPGTNYVGIEVPNFKPQTVFLGDVLAKAGPGCLQMVIGEDVEGGYVIDDLSKMPHLLVAGTTGSGKSVAINGMIMSILMRATPAEVRFIMIDPKRVEFTPYNGIPHLYVPVVTECREAASALAWAVAEMEKRLKLFANVGARNIGQYNQKVANGMEIGEEPAEQLPFIVIVIDELADLMMNVGKEVEFSISRLAQLARAAGIHMIIATQRPSTNIVTGLIKANITCRIALNVASGIDSRVILDQTGAENLIGNGDMLFAKPEYPKPVRLQGCFTSPKEIEAVVEHLKAQGDPEYHNEILQTNLITLGSSSVDGSGGSGGGSEDPLLWEAAEIVVNSGLGSTSNIQRRLSVGYSRAGRIMDMLEEKGIVGPPNGSKPREVLIDALELESLKAFEMNDSDTGE